MERRGNVTRIAPGLYKVRGMLYGSRMIRIRSTRTVKDTTGHSVANIPKRWEAIVHENDVLLGSEGHTQPLLLGAFETRVMLRQGFSKATDGCTVAPDAHCVHGYPSNAVRWGMV